MVELIPKAKRPKPAYSIADVFFRISLAVLGISLVLSGTLFFVYQKKLSALETLEQKFKELFQAPEEKIIADIIAYNLQAERAKEISKDVVKPFDAVTLIADKIHPKARIVSAGVKLADRKAALSMKTENLRTFWEQIRILRKAKEIGGVDITRLTVGANGEVIFDIELSFTFGDNFFVWAQSSS